MATDLLHREAKIGDSLFEGNTCAFMAEVFTGGVQGAAIFLGEFLVINHDFEQRTKRAEFGGGKLIEQGVSLLEFVLEIGAMRFTPLRYRCGSCFWAIM